VARAIEIADLLSASSVRIDSAMSKEKQLDFETRVKIFVEGLGGALERTSGSKVTLGIENHGFQGNNLAFLLNTFQQVGSDRLGSTLDVATFTGAVTPCRKSMAFSPSLRPMPSTPT
jgi:sugar phosphate isomerase/epimerase